MIANVGFTGTRDGMTEAQERGVEGVLRRLGAQLVVHGDCVGADEQFHRIAQRLGIKVRIRPSIYENLRAFCGGTEDDIRPPMEPLTRNKYIVSDTEALIATPKTAEEKVRSGTWSTVRRARKMRSPVFLVLPDGEVIDEMGVLNGS